VNVNELHHVIVFTKEMTVEYLKPVLLHKSLHVEGRKVSVHGHQHINTAEILNEKAEASSSLSTPKNVRKVRGKIAVSSQPSAKPKRVRVPDPSRVFCG
jgi:acyl-CoA thioesterase FadM